MIRQLEKTRLGTETSQAGSASLLRPALQQPITKHCDIDLETFTTADYLLYKSAIIHSPPPSIPLTLEIQRRYIARAADHPPPRQWANTSP
jgi:hypothetical protein